MKYSARVIPGRGEGRKIGFPTLNLEIPEGFEAKQGIYAGWVMLAPGDGKRRPAAFHYGPVPAFAIGKTSLEAHVIGMDIPTPPEEASFELVKYLRPVLDFTGLDSLKSQIEEDVRQALNVLKEYN